MGPWVVSGTSALLLAFLAVCLWFRRPPAPLWPVVFFCQVFALLWVLGDLWATTATTGLEKQIALAVLFSGSVPISVAWWTTARRYVESHGLQRPWMRHPVVLWLPPAYAAADRCRRRAPRRPLRGRRPASRTTSTTCSPPSAATRP